MRYGDLVRFEPIDTVIQLQDADREAEARRLVETFVISAPMAERLADVVIPQLQFLEPRDNKGVLVVGNYGTGKSHLMSVVSAVAEYPDLATSLGNARVREAAGAIAGRFKVLRVEIGAVTRGLRDILLDELEQALERWGTPFTFPPASALTNHKDVLIQAVGAFQERYPGQGILLVVDELLDFLRNREERALILDLGFLRELGEVAELTPFRFMGGLQETLFDSPRFAFVAEPLRRVRDRFEQVRIAREDIAFVVAERLLKKDDAQLAKITEHLRPYTPLYARMADKLDEFARLFPIHPAYIDTFEALLVVEQRQVLRTLSRAMGDLLERSVPAGEPGLISYDHYWNVLRNDPSMRGLPGVAEVIEKAGVLEGRVEGSYTRPHLLPMARRIIHALGVLRLTTEDIRAPLGATPEELRDNLCLHAVLPEPSAEFLAGQVRVALREITRTVSGQYLTHNEENDQYYLDVRKDVDFDAKIRDRGEAFDRSDLDRFFFDALRQVLNLSDTTYLNVNQLWEIELPWADRKITRPGYLFFRPPDERTTAQPRRDFLLYVLPPFASGGWKGEVKEYEVVFRLTGLPQTFEALVRRYAGARAMANDSPTYRSEYTGEAEVALRRLRTWLQDNLADHLRVEHGGVTRTVAEVLAQTRSSASRDMADLLYLLASTLLAPGFADRYPNYPAFRRLAQPVTEAARSGTAAEAIRVLAGRPRTNQGMAVLDAFGLLDGDTIRPSNSPYAQRYLEMLAAKPDGQVVNRGEVIETVAGGVAKPIEKDLRFCLEPEWVAVLLVALVYDGAISLTLDGRETLQAATVERAATIAVDALANFRFFAKPKDLPLGVLTALFEGLGLQPALIRDEATRERAVQELQATVNRELERAVRLQTELAQGVRLWNAPLFSDKVQFEAEKGAVVGSNLPANHLTSTSLMAGLRGYKTFLEGLTRFNTPGKLRNLTLTHSEVIEAMGHRQTVTRAEDLLRLVGQLQPLTTYLAGAEGNLDEDHPWTVRAAEVRDRVVGEVRRFGRGESGQGAPALLQELEALKQEYVAAYAAQHRKLTLGPVAETRRHRLQANPRLTALRSLAAVDLLDKAELQRWNLELGKLRSCLQFHEGAIEDQPICKDCGLRPAQADRREPAEQALDRLDRRLDDLLTGWRRALKESLRSETAQQSLAAMTAEERGPIEAFLAQRGDETDIPSGFAAAATTALRGISAVTLWQGDLMDALAVGGLPCTEQELKRRFNEFVMQQRRGKDVNATRFTLAVHSPHLAAAD